MAEITYLQAINDAMREEMERDPQVFLLGEDVGYYGGAFKVTKGLIEKFGEDRVIDTPISESAIAGAAIGAAITGMRPIAEMQFADFITVAFNQLVSNAATMHYRFGIPVPMVVRAPSGGRIHGGPFHSKNPEAWFSHQPGLKVVAPATVYDAKGLLKSAIRDNNPVIYFEHKYYYRRLKQEIDENEENLVPLGKANIVKPGDDLTIITYGGTLHMCTEAAEKAEKEDGLDIQVIDLRTLAPLDKSAILDSVRKTSRVVIVHEADLTGGIGGEVAAIIAEKGFEYLDAPVRRVASTDTPTPYSPILEEVYYPNVSNILNAVRETAAF